MGSFIVSIIAIVLSAWALLATRREEKRRERWTAIHRVHAEWARNHPTATYEEWCAEIKHLQTVIQ